MTIKSSKLGSTIQTLPLPKDTNLKLSLSLDRLGGSIKTAAPLVNLPRYPYFCFYGVGSGYKGYSLLACFL